MSDGDSTTRPPGSRTICGSRIASGELAAGARMPSTRALVQRHGVAMATATKVLTTLRHEGLIHSVPGVGTSWPGNATAPARRTGRRGDGPRRRPPSGSTRSWPRASRVADAEGLAALSMRRVAGRARRRTRCRSTGTCATRTSCC